MTPGQQRPVSWYMPRSVQWTVGLLGVMSGGAIGLGLYTFVYAEGASYLTNDPNACANCHVMRDHLDAWVKSSHKHVATCNDCHAPHNFFGKYLTKMVNGFNHSLAFTTGRFQKPFQITSFNRSVIEGACRSCHQAVVHAIDPVAQGEAALSCIRCHSDVGHDY